MPSIPRQQTTLFLLIADTVFMIYALEITGNPQRKYNAPTVKK